jgi:hypothetical protein
MGEGIGIQICLAPIAIAMDRYQWLVWLPIKFFPVLPMKAEDKGRQQLA